MESRTKLKELYKERTEINTRLANQTNVYMDECGDKPLLYITEHAIVRYAERIMGLTFDESLTDAMKLTTINIPPQVIRRKMITRAAEVDIVKNMRSMYSNHEAVYIIKNLSILTVLTKGMRDENK